MAAVSTGGGTGGRKPKKPQPKAEKPLKVFSSKKSQKSTQVKRARNDINKSVGEQAVKIVGSKKNADVVVRPFKSKKAAATAASSSDGGYQGQYREHGSRNDVIVVATNKQRDKNYHMNRPVGEKYGWPTGMSAMSNLTEHEIGHALGLNHSQSGTIMNGGLTFNKKQKRKIRKRVGKKK